MTKEKAIRILSTRDNQGMPVTWQKGFLEAYEMAIEALKAQKTGKWMKYEGRFDYEVECSECECSAYWKSAYCPNCGAKLE